MKGSKELARRLSILEKDRGVHLVVDENTNAVDMLYESRWTRAEALRFLWDWKQSSTAGPGEPRDPKRVLKFLQLCEGQVPCQIASGFRQFRPCTNTVWKFHGWSLAEARAFGKIHRWAGDIAPEASYPRLMAEMTVEERGLLDDPGFLEKLDRLFEEQDAVEAEDERILAAIAGSHP